MLFNAVRPVKVFQHIQNLMVHGSHEVAVASLRCQGHAIRYGAIALKRPLQQDVLQSDETDARAEERSRAWKNAIIFLKWGRGSLDPITPPFLALGSASASFAPITLQGGFVMEQLQRRFGAGIGVWFRTAAAKEGCARGSLSCGLCEFVDRCNAKGSSAYPRRVVQVSPEGRVRRWNWPAYSGRSCDPETTRRDRLKPGRCCPPPDVPRVSCARRQAGSEG